jgi:hypothetical protein
MERPAYTLLSEPEILQNIETGAIRETYALDGRNIGFLAGGATVVFNDFTLHFHKDREENLQHVYLDVMNLPVPTFKQIGAITGLPTDLAAMQDAATVMVRFEMLPEPRAKMNAAFEQAPTMSAFFDTADDAGEGVLWNFTNYATESLIGG